MAGHGYDRLRAGLFMPGLLLAAQDDPVAPIIESLLTIWFASEAEEWFGVIWYLPL